jgi:Fe-S-cluster containining protein
MRQPLPVITTCEHCGACCQVVGFPPFRRHFDGPGEEAWERLRLERPDQLTALVEAIRSRRAAGLPTVGTPCPWLDPATLRCQHYEYRPADCRAFERGGSDCQDTRRRAGIA